MKIKKVVASIVMATVLSTSIVPNLGIQQSIVYAAEDSGNFSLNGDTLSMTKGSDKIDLQVCSSKIFKVNYKPNGEEDPETLVIDPNKKWGTGNITESDIKSDPAVIKTDDMTIKISKSDLSIVVYDKSGKEIVKQNAITSAKNLSFTYSEGQDFYGISGYNKDKTPQDGTLRTGSYKVECGSQGYVGGPFTWSTGGYGLLVDSDGGQMEIQDSSLKYSGISKKNSEYFIMVGTPTEVMEGQAEVSGKAPMYPKWATGFTNTQWGWRDGSTPEDQLKKVIEKYRAEHYPIDNFCLDFDWKCWGQLDVPSGEFKWNTKNFPSASDGKLKEWAESEGIHLTGIMKPRLFLETEEAKTMESKGWWYTDHQEKDYCAGKPVRICDFGNADLRNWWWKQTEDAFDKGLAGYWNDECDIENGFNNFSNLNMQRAMYEGQREYSKDSQRVWSINRNYYTGAQRYAYGSWSGDITSSFESMKSQKDRLIAAVNLGEAKWGMDTGGFNGSPNPENYARWVEFSAFTPIFRVHGQKVPGATERYPWMYGETAAAAAKKVMQLRYKLIPYIYKYDYQASDTGVGLVKSLMMEYPNDKNAKANTDSWMFGDYMLVSPVLDQGQTSKNIYLPQGTWTDYFTGKTYVGGQTINYAVNAEKWDDVPLFIKQGAIIPSQDYVDYVGQKKMENIYVDAFPDIKETTFDYYDDDGNSYDYEKGKYFKQKLSLSRNDDWTAVRFKTGKSEGSYTPDVKNYIVKLHVKATGDVTVNGDKVKKYGTLEALTGASGDGYAVGTDTYGDVVYVKIASGDINTIEAPCDFPAAPEQNTKVYIKSSDSDTTIEYSVDGGKNWSDGEKMKASGNLGYLESDITYSLKSNSALMVRYNKDGKYYPSNKGIELKGSGSEFAITSDGKLSEGLPAMTTAKLYLKSSDPDSEVPVVVQYKDSDGWSDSIILDPCGSDPGQYTKALSYESSQSNITIRYSDDNGKTWKPSNNGAKIASGDYMNGDDGAIKEGNPDWQNTVTIYYKQGKTKMTNVHWSANGGSWNGIPGDPMEDCSDFKGYSKVVLKIGTATGAEVCFNDGKEEWDSNNKENYKFTMGVNTISDGKITPGDPDGKHATKIVKKITVSSSVKGGIYNKNQSVKLTASDSSAKIYYTLDGTDPTEKSTRYSDAIEVSKDTTIKAIAIDADGNKSAINTQKYVIKADPEDPGKDPEDPGKDPVYDKLTKVTITSGSKSTAEGNKVKFTASCNTNDPSVKYAFGYYDDNNKWVQLRKYTDESTFSWTTTKAGTYGIVVKAKSDTVSEIESNSYEVQVKAEEEPPTHEDKFDSVTVSSDISSAEVGDKVKLTASPNVEDSSIEYQFGYYKNNKWKVLRDYDTSKTYTWNTSESGTYNIYVRAKNDDDQVESESAVKVIIKDKEGDNDPNKTFDSNNLIMIFVLLAASTIAICGANKKKRV